MLILFECNNPDCDNNIKKYFKNKQLIPPFLDCGECGTGKLEKRLCPPTSNSTQIVDNGIQARRVEVMDAVLEKEKDILDRDE